MSGKEKNLRGTCMKMFKEQNQPHYNCKANDIVIDLKTIMPDFYFAQFLECGNKLKIQIDNGQKFMIKVKECSKL